MYCEKQQTLYRAEQMVQWTLGLNDFSMACTQLVTISYRPTTAHNMQCDGTEVGEREQEAVTQEGYMSDRVRRLELYLLLLWCCPIFMDNRNGALRTTESAGGSDSQHAISRETGSHISSSHTRRKLVLSQKLS